MNVQREARRDAKEYARAQMYYGEGAGTRRKLISATVEAKAHRNPEYARVFHSELSRQDMSEHATKARHERDRRDASHAMHKNARGLLTGNYQSVQTGVLLGVVAAYFAHQSGYDKKIMEKGKEFVQNLRARIKHKKAVDDLLTELRIPH